MTGFGAATVDGVQVQIATVNHRSVQVGLRADLGDLALEEELRRRIRDAIGRGAATVQIAATGAAATVDRARIAAVWRELAGLAAELGAQAPALDMALRLAGAGEPRPSAAGVLAALDAALAALDAARLTEGARLADFFRSEAARLRGLHVAMGAIARGRVDRHREALRARLAEVVADGPDLIRDLAAYSERIDVTEELVRLAAHLDRLDALLGEDQPGRALDFLMQEIGRELNTTGAKSQDAALTALVLDARLAADRLKEQAANLL
jgi:uncharacterized protein YicC (UPF0701 family)